MSLSQNEMGRAFEYGIAVSLSEYLSGPVGDSIQVREQDRLSSTNVLNAKTNPRHCSQVL
ncbi:MAG: hypothetical protein DDT32_02053 [Syntrophomonadaceae bacterium]|nr:hypothetical protein [Bacillota bacterium]